MLTKHGKTRNDFIVRGRSEDGTVYATDFGGWTEDKRNAKRFTFAAACERQDMENAKKERWVYRVVID